MAVQLESTRMKTFALCLFSLLIVQGHGTLPVRISSKAIAKEGENACSSQGNIESQLNVTKEEIRNRISDKVNQFLDSSRPCGGSRWIRVAYLNMTDPGSVCLTNWTLHTSPVRGCGQTQTASSTCDSAFFSVSSQSYSRVMEWTWKRLTSSISQFMGEARTLEDFSNSIC